MHMLSSIRYTIDFFFEIIFRVDVIKHLCFGLNTTGSFF
jgi:hypothetical protein